MDSTLKSSDALEGHGGIKPTGGASKGGQGQHLVDAVTRVHRHCPGFIHRYVSLAGSEILDLGLVFTTNEVNMVLSPPTSSSWFRDKP